MVPLPYLGRYSFLCYLNVLQASELIINKLPCWPLRCKQPLFLFCRCYFGFFLTQLPYSSLLNCTGSGHFAVLEQNYPVEHLVIKSSLKILLNVNENWKFNMSRHSVRLPLTFIHRRVAGSTYSFSFAVYEEIYSKKLLLYNCTLVYVFKRFLRNQNLAFFSSRLKLFFLLFFPFFFFDNSASFCSPT